MVFPVIKQLDVLVLADYHGVSPDYPARLRNDCYGKKLLSLHNKNLGLPMELEDSFAPFLFIMDKDLCVKYLHIHNKPLPRLTLIYLEEIKKMW